ncbi:rnhA operon protein [Halobacteriales archaeon Cl-PHB]
MTADDTPDADGTDEATDTPPEDVVDEAQRLSRLARDVADDAEAAVYREERDALLAEYDYETRIREDDGRAMLVCYPAEWVDDEGTVDMRAVEDVTRGVERPLEGPGSGDDWAAVDEHNRAIVAEVREAHGEVHGDNAAALADFAGNHYAKGIDRLTGDEVEEFREEYFPRNAWPSDEQGATLEESIRLTFEAADEDPPNFG